MSNNTKLTIPVTVELSGALSTLAEAKGIHAFELHLAATVQSLLERLGLSGEPTVTVQSVTSNRAVRVRVHGSLQPYHPNLLRGVWLSVAPPELRAVPDTQAKPSDKGFPDKWLTAYVSGLSDTQSDLGIIFEYLTHLVIEIMAERPGCLVGPEQASAYLGTAPVQTDEMQTIISTEEMMSLLKSLLNLGVYVADRTTVWRLLAAGQQVGRSIEDIAESIFTQLRSARLEIHLHPAYLGKCLKSAAPAGAEADSSDRVGAFRKFFNNVISTLTPAHATDKLLPVYSPEVNEVLQGRFLLMEQQIFNELNLHLPELVLVASPEIKEGLIAIKINDRLATPIAGLQPGELLVNASVEQLIALNVPGRTMNNPVDNSELAVISEAHQQTVEQGGYQIVNIASFVLVFFYSEVMRRLDQLIGIEDAEYQLAQLKQVFPKLVSAVTAPFSMGNLTWVLRELAAEGISTYDARAILERMLQFDTITVASASDIAFDERLELSPVRAAEKVDSRQSHCEFVRSGLKYFIGRRYSQLPNLINVYLLDHQVQARAEEAKLCEQATDAVTWMDEAEQEALRDSVWANVRDAGGRPNTPILTTAKARVPIKELIAAEIPAMPVIAFSELGPEIRLTKQGTIKLDG